MVKLENITIHVKSENTRTKDSDRQITGDEKRVYSDYWKGIEIREGEKSEEKGKGE